MKDRVRKAVFPAAGLGTRFLPATKALPKEMLALVDKPLIQYGVEEAIAAGCEQIIIVTGRNKAEIEDHFDISFELEQLLEKRGKTELLAMTRQISHMARIAYVRQKEAMGLGHAVLMARDLVGDEPFAVILPDDIIEAKVPCLQQMIEVFERTQSTILATQVVDGPSISSYGVLDCIEHEGSDRIFDVKGLVEKPKAGGGALTTRDHRALHSHPQNLRCAGKDAARHRRGTAIDGWHPRPAAVRKGLRVQFRWAALRCRRQARHAQSHGGVCPEPQRAGDSFSRVSEIAKI